MLLHSLLREISSLKDIGWLWYTSLACQTPFERKGAFYQRQVKFQNVHDFQKDMKNLTFFMKIILFSQKKGAFCLFEAFSWAVTDFKALKAPFLSDFTRLTRKYRRIVKCAFLNDQTCFPIILPKSPIWAWKSCTFWTFTWRF